jgi:hypothetical protein
MDSRGGAARLRVAAEESSSFGGSGVENQERDKGEYPGLRND